MNTSNQNQYIVRLYVDRDAACLAGYDQHGTIERTVKPSELSDQQRKTLVEINFNLNESTTGSKINGTESVEQLLDRAYNKILADQEKEQKRIDETVEILTRRIVENSPYNPHFIDERTGRLEIEQGKHALIQITAEKATKTWEDRYFYRSVGSLYFGKDQSIDEIRDRVLSNPDVIGRITSLKNVAEHIQAQLNRAKETRDRIAAKHEAQAEIEKERAAQARKEQLATFVFGLDELSQRKWAEDLLPDQEILERYANTVFLKIDLQFQAVDRAELGNEVRRYYAENFNIDDDCVVSYLDREPDELADDAFLMAEAIAGAVKTQYPGAKTEILLLVGYLSDYSDALDPELITPIMRVTIKEGEIDFTREYRLEAMGGAHEL